MIKRYDELTDLAKSLAFEVWAAGEYKNATKILKREVKSKDRFTRGFAIKALASIDPEQCRITINDILADETDLFVLSRIHDAEEIIEK